MGGDDEPLTMLERPWVRAVMGEPDPKRTLNLYAHYGTLVQDRYADLEEVLRGAAGVEEDLRELWQANERDRIQASNLVVANLLTKGPLRAGLDRDAAVDVLCLYISTSNFLWLVRRQGWSLQRYEAWLASTICEQLLPGSGAAPPETMETASEGGDGSSDARAASNSTESDGGR